MAVRILVVDDEPDLELLIRQKFRKRIREEDYEFHFAANGLEALARLDEIPDIELVLTDLNMPEMDGLTLLGDLAERAPLLRAVVVSAYGDMENIRAAMNRGAFDFITKPIDFQDLEVTIDKTVREVRGVRAGIEARRRLRAIQREMELAVQIQRSILPKSFPERHDVDVHGEMMPALSVGGDFYDFYFLDDGRLAFLIGDVSGKGMSAALFMAVSRSLVKATALTGVAPNECLKHVNDLLCADDAAGMFVTLFYGILDTRSGALTYSNAGHNPPVVLSGNREPWSLRNLGGIVLGVQPGHEYAAGAVELQPGEGVFLYTDGVTDAVNEGGARYTQRRLDARLRALNSASAREITAAVLEDVRAFVQDAPPHDDITMLAVRYLGKE
ncbi:MAG TPA: SpoIIE family protein phosphatase [Candidatus Hydrogenedentes bacterium]|nr:SpoIIE family protein phosphatase [Candidatus Hydrogenedentota bacterium]HNT86710.1 SpoIIE family protein phosphatase [Candidatus Hydrogenedentota bacterium]